MALCSQYDERVSRLSFCFGAACLGGQNPSPRSCLHICPSSKARCPTGRSSSLSRQESASGICRLAGRTANQTPPQNSRFSRLEAVPEFALGQVAPRKTTRQFRPLVLDEGDDGLRRFVASPGRKVQQGDSAGGPLVGENNLFEVFVLGQSSRPWSTARSTISGSSARGEISTTATRHDQRRAKRARSQNRSFHQRQSAWARCVSRRSLRTTSLRWRGCQQRRRWLRGCPLG